MAFRRRNEPLQRVPVPPRGPPGPQPERGAPPTSPSPQRPAGSTTPVSSSSFPSPRPSPHPPAQAVTGVRPSPLTGQPTLSTGLAPVDVLFAGHGGLPLGSVLLLEQGAATAARAHASVDGPTSPVATADYVSVLLKFFAAQALPLGHRVHVLGLGAAGPDGDDGDDDAAAGWSFSADRSEWLSGLPGLDEATNKAAAAAAAAAPAAPTPSGAQARPGTTAAAAADRMKIAWRYSRLSTSPGTAPAAAANYRHAFDLRARTDGAVASKLVSFAPFTAAAVGAIRAAALAEPGVVHRIVVPPPSLLDGAGVAEATGYGRLSALHALRAAVKEIPAVAMVAHSASLVPRTTALCRWAEILADGVVELVVLPADEEEDGGGSGKGRAPGEAPAGQAGGDDFVPHGFLKLHKQVTAERGGCVKRQAGRESENGEAGQFVFRLERRTVLVKPYVLPPLLDDEGEKKEVVETKKEKGKSKGEKEIHAHQVTLDSAVPAEPKKVSAKELEF